MNQISVRPIDIRLKKSKAQLIVSWNDGSESQLSGQLLRQFCACSRCRASNVVGKALITDAEHIETINPIGYAGIQIVFADGHDRGIYPWDYLRAIAAGNAMEHLNA